MSLLLSGCKELTYGELLSVNGGCVGYTVRVSSTSPVTTVNMSPVSYSTPTTSFSGSCTASLGPGATMGPTITNPGVGLSGNCSINCDYNKKGMPMPIDSTKNTNNNLLSAINANMGKEYVFGTWDCDIFVETVLKSCGNNISKLWGSAASNNVQTHADKLSKYTTSKPEKGWSIVMMTKSDKYSVDHCGLAYVNKDGSVDFYNNTKSAGHVILEKYKSVSAFQKDFAYSTFDYYKVNL